MNQYSKSQAFRHFVQHAPRRPRATNILGEAAPLMGKREALECANIQIQPAEMRFSIAVDIDSEETAAHVLELDFPQPQLLMLNPENGHGHAIWQIAEGVSFGPHTRRKPQRAFLDLQRQVRILAEGDPYYAHYMVKTPGHARWRTLINDVRPYSMGELFEAVPAGVAKQARERKERTVNSEGRHQTLFDVGRIWAYGEVKRYRHREYDAWLQRVTAEFICLNSFAEPLGVSEVHGLARSVAAWCWVHADTLKGGVLAGQKRSLQKSWERAPMTPEEAKERMAAGGRHAGAVQRNKTYDAITEAIGRLAAAGITQPSVSLLAREAGRDRSTVRAFLRAAEQQHGN